MIKENFTLAPDCEYGVEVDPRRIGREHIQALREIGANRGSLGVQDTNSKVQLAVHRWQPHELNQRVVGWMREEGFHSINIDLIYGLPIQTEDSFSQTIDEVLGLTPERFSVFSYAHVPWIKPAQKIFDDRGQLPSPEQKLTMFAAAHTKLTQAGYFDIGLDHFARPEDELSVAQRAGTLQRNFQGYSTRADASLYAFGMSSISSTPNTYRQNHKTLPAWRDALARGELPTERGLRLTDEDIRRRTIIMRLMCDRHLDFSHISRLIGVDFAKTYAQELSSLSDLEADGIVIRDDKRVEVTRVGVPLLRVVAMRFDATYVSAPRRHAQTV
jgi:oxygen-independent coproporphyrinogen-3 oxidase